MTALRAQEGVAARALEFAILTAARTGEVIGAKWNEIDLRDKVWAIPAERMKTRPRTSCSAIREGHQNPQNDEFR